MEDLNLPIIKGPGPKPKILSMDDYARFVLLNLKYTVDINAAREWKKKASVNVPFRLK
ncbi:hypothetical protein ACFLQ8_01725 [Candidatus Auribacterota bacterium]